MIDRLHVTSPSFADEDVIPIRHTGRGEDTSPELHLSELHADARSLAITMDDLDHPIPAYNHWVIWNVPAMRLIPPNVAHGPTIEYWPGAVQGCGYGRHRYRGPKPPFHASHRYQFNVYVLDCLLDLSPRARKRHLLEAMRGHVLQQGRLVGRFR